MSNLTLKDNLYLTIHLSEVWISGIYIYFFFKETFLFPIKAGDEAGWFLQNYFYVQSGSLLNLLFLGINYMLSITVEMYVPCSHLAQKIMNLALKIMYLIFYYDWSALTG